jgi:transglutaminase-like putative cysteine protease
MDSYFRTTSYALVVTAFLAIALTGELDGVSIALYAVAVAVCYYRDARGAERFRLREWMWRALSIGYVPFIFVDAAIISNRVLALVHMTLFVSAAKLFQTKRDRDWVFLYLIAFFQMLLAAGLTFDATFIASLALFLFFFISTLAAFEIRRSGREVTSLEEETVAPLKQQRIKYRGKPETPRKSHRVRYLLGASLVQIVIIAALALPFFFLIPRLGGGGVARGIGEGQPITGFSEHVKLGDVASIKKSSRVVLRVQLNRQPGKYLRWRGMAFDYYDGRSWTVGREPGRTETENQGEVGVAPGADNSIQYRHPLRVAAASEPSWLQQRFVLEPLETSALFAAQKAVSVQGPMAVLYRDKLTGNLSAVALKGRVAYGVTSDISAPSEQELQRDTPAASPDQIKRVYATARKLDPRISQLAHEITRNAPTPYDKAKAIESYLKTNFRYTLDLKGGDEDPLAEFLFETREGHCEYFATAMTIMLRTLDIPARIVNGFQMGEYNELNDMYTVRESDAHSWVEVYFPRSESWIEFDPTPAAGINDYSAGGLWARLRKYADAMEVFWLDYIVTLDSEEQASIMVDMQHRLLSIKDHLLVFYSGVRLWTRDTLKKWIVDRQWSASDLIKLASSLVAICLGAMSMYVFLAYRKRRGVAPSGYGPWWHRFFILPTWRRKLAGRDYRQSAVLFYEQMLAIAKRAGLIKQTHQTPLEFADAAGLAPIREITVLYNRVRFGGAQLDSSETRRVMDLLAELKQSIRSRR